MPKHSYLIKEYPCRNGAMEIYGVAYVPVGQKRSPLVIFSHELGNNHTAGIRYAEKLAEAGYAAYVFDFRGGSVGENRSDGSNIGMSVMTEVSDLEAILASAASWDFVDPEQIVLFGGSQGADVSIVTGRRHADRIAGLILMYPPLDITERMRERFGTKDAIPEEFGMFGGWICVGRNYAADIWDLDLYSELAAYPGTSLLLHGDRDTTVDISISRKAAACAPRCRFYPIEGGKHGFFGKPFEDAVEHILVYLQSELRRKP